MADPDAARAATDAGEEPGGERAGPEYLTTRELAELLRIKERKVYELAAAGDVPCAKVTGKLLFPERAVRRWLAAGTIGPGTDRAPGDAPRAERPATLLGSHDPLLEWALRESGAGLASYFDGSRDGVERFARGAAVAAALHLLDGRPVALRWAGIAIYTAALVAATACRQWRRPPRRWRPLAAWPRRTRPGTQRKAARKG